MIKLKRIVNPDEVRLTELQLLYKESFPAEERRETEQLKYLLTNRPEMYFNAIECDGELAGLFVFWNFNDFYYMEHLAVFPEMRNKEIGRQVLDFARENLKGSRLLEVEPPEDEMTTRRVNYYQRNGYKILDKSYIQPSYDGIRSSIPLWIMGNEAYSDPRILQKHTEMIITEVYIKNWKLTDSDSSK